MNKLTLRILTFLLSLCSIQAFSQGSTCAQATPFCTPPGNTVTFPNSTSTVAQSGPNYGCLSTQPNPAWFYFKTTTAGTYKFNLSQSNGSTGIDVDFICWGPFTDPYTACNNLTAGNTVDCSYSASYTETCTVSGAPAGQYYILLITNYSGQSGNITFGLTASSPNTDCSITCPTVLSGPGLVNVPMNGTVAAVPLPATVSCTTGLVNMYASNNTPFGNPITPGVMIKLTSNNNASNAISWYENSTLLSTVGVPVNTNYQLQVGYMSPSAANTFDFCETDTPQPNTSTYITDAATSGSISSFVWLDDGNCQAINIPAGTIKGITTWSSTCGACLTNVTDWGFAQFDPSKANIGSNTITYTFNPQQPGCSSYTTSVTFNVTNPFNAAFTPPGPLCAGGACVNLTPTNTYTVGTGTWSGTGVSGTQFCPGTSGTGTFAVTYTVGTSSTCKSTATNNVIVNPLPAASAGPTASLTCTNASTVLTGSGGGTYSWSGPGITGGGSTATPTVNLGGTYVVTVTAGGCSKTASTTVTQNTATPVVAASFNGTVGCTTTTAQAIASTTTTPASYTWSGPGIVSGGTTGTVTVNAGGTYNYTVTNTATGCKTTGSVAVPQNTATPAVAASVSNTLTCTTTTVNAIASTTSTPVSYTWSGPGVVSGGATGTVVVNTGGTYNYTVTNTASGCKTTGSIAVTQNTATPAVAASSSGTLTCTATTVNAMASTTATPVSYTWSGPGIVSGGTTGTVTVNAGGTYNYTVTNTSNGCKTTGSVAVAQNTATPSVTASASGTITCVTTTVNAMASTTATPVSYNWSGPGIVSGGATGTLVVNAGGTYNYTVTNTSNGCNTIGSIAVTQSAGIPPVTASVSGTLSCTTTTVNAIASTTATPVSYTWSGPGIVSGGATGTVVVNAGGAYNYTVTNTSNGCKAMGSLAVTQNTVAPSVAASASATLTCATTTANAMATTTATPVSYNWSGPGIVSGGATGTVVVNAGGTYDYTVTNTSNGCKTTGAVAVTQNTATPAVAASSGGTLTCTTTTVNAMATTTATPVSYNWSGPGIVSGSATGTVVVNAGGTYNYTVTNTSNSCKTTGSIAVSQNTATPSVASSNTGSLNCTTTTVNAIASTTATPVSYTWTGPGIVSGGATGTAVVNAGGTYNYTVTNTSDGCKATGSVAISQNTTVITPTVTLPSVLNCTNTSVSLSAAPGAGVTYTWTGASVTSGVNSANATADQPGVYSISVTNTANDCVGTATVSVTQNTATPTVSVSPTQTITCASPTVSISGSATPSTCTPVWTGGVCAGGNSYTASACSPGSFVLTVTDPANACTASGTVSVVPSVGLPSVTASNSGSITCTTTTVEVVATTTSTPVSYSWSGPGTVMGASTANGTVTVGGVYQCVVTNTMTGCSSTITTNVPTDTAVPAATIAPTSSITCSTTSLTLNAGPSGSPYSISWTGAGLTGSTVATPTVTQGGNYAVTITDTVNGCAGTANITVPSNTVAPTLTVSPGSYTTSCASPTVQLTANSSDPSVTYSWSVPPTGSLDNTTIQNPIASGTGVFTVVITSTVSGCSSSLSSNSTATVVPNASIPTVSLSASTVSMTCSSATASVVATTTTTPVSYSWSPNPLSGGNTDTPVFDTPGTYTLTLTNTSNGCFTFASVVVTTNTTAPSVTVSPAQALTCSTTSVTISTTVTPSGGMTYSWTGLGIIGSNSNASVDVNQADTYTVVVTDATNGCTNTAVSTVSGNTVAPTASITAVSASSVISCSSPAITLSVSTTPATGLTYTWTPGGATTSTTTVNGAGTVTVTVLNAASGCSVNATFAVTGNTTQPAVSLNANASIPCGASSATISASSTNTAVTYSWTGPNAGSITGGGNTSTPSIVDPGNYTVTATDPSNGCTTTSVVSVSQTSVTAAFTADPTTGIAPLDVNFTNNSSGATGYTWIFGDGNGSNATNPSNTYNTNSSFTVELIATAGPCSDTAYAVIVVESGLTFEIPNVFTPNGDGTNDVFTIKSTGVKEISLQIFNRWGEKLYEFTGPKAGWDGKTGEGSKVPDGTYFYFVKATGFDTKVIEKQGTVNLYR